jgi:predicted PurR-regulated permease PerM
VHLARTWLNCHLFRAAQQKSRQFNQAANAGVNYIWSIYVKFIITILFLFVCFSITAEELQVNTVPDKQSSQLDKEEVDIEKQVLALNKKLEELKKLQSEIDLNIAKNLNFQQEIQPNTESLLKTALAEKEELPSLKVHLLQSTNLYIFALPIVTIFIVLGGTFLSLRTIKIKSEESIEALEKSNQNQVQISEKNNASERLKSQEAIISNSRQKWINTLRDEISSLVSHQTQHSASDNKRKAEIFTKTWGELFKIELLLNPKEELHNELLKELNNGFAICVDSENQDEYREKRAVIMQLSKKILKQEWQRVKSFE